MIFNNYTMASIMASVDGERDYTTPSGAPTGSITIGLLSKVTPNHSYENSMLGLILIQRTRFYCYRNVRP
jgi:hypothetical protein